MKSLCRAIIWSSCFLELSGDDVVDPDSAIKALEDISSYLLEATDEEKQAFIEACEEEANRAEKDGRGSEVSDYIRALPSAVGLIEDDDGEGASCVEEPLRNGAEEPALSAPKSITDLLGHEYNMNAFCVRCGWARDYIERNQKPCTA